MTHSILIVDDEAPARRKTRRLLEGESDWKVVGEAVDGDDAVEKIRGLDPDVVLLDIQMPKRSGFEVIDEVGVDDMPVVIFSTAFDEHAVAAFEVEAVDYLLKPYSARRLRGALERARRRLAEDPAAASKQLQQVLATLRGPEPRFLRRLQVEVSPHREVLVDVSTIDLLRAKRNYVGLESGSVTYRCRGPLSRLEQRLDPEEFVRINRSEIVRVGAVVELQPWFHGDYRVILASGETLSWSRRYRARGKRAFEGRGGGADE